MDAEISNNGSDYGVARLGCLCAMRLDSDMKNDDRMVFIV